MTTTVLERRGLTRLAVLSLPAAAVLLLPSGAIAATSGSGNSTVRGTIGGDGSIKSVRVYAPDGSTSSFNGTMPVKVTISRTVSGSTSTYTYHVENTFSKTQQITYTDTAGKSHSSTVDVQLPLVARLGIDLPKSFSNVSAPNAVVQTDPNGANRILFTMVLFSPLGSPTQDATFTATGKGAPTAELSATTVNPSTTAGISQSAQDANASSQQDDFWSSFASGGNGGLTQLATGVGQMVTGLAALSPGAHQLADGIKAAGAGAIKLDDGTKAAHKGAKQLSTGIGQIHGGQVQLTSGLKQIHGGLAQLDGKVGGPGLQGAVDGVTAIEGGVQQVLAGLQGIGGTTSKPTFTKDAQGNTVPSVLQALNAGAAELPPTGGIHASVTTARQSAQAALGLIETNAAAIGGAIGPTALTTLLTELGTAAAPANDPFFAGTPLANGGILPGVEAGLTSLSGGLTQITIGLNAHTPGTFGPTDKGGIDFGLLSLLDPKKGLPAAVGGVDQLYTGSTKAVAGSKLLTAGSGKAFTGSKALVSGLGQLSAGQHQVATGLPAAVTGSAQIADGADQLLAGAQQVHTGILAVQTGAVAPLLQQISEGSLNAKKQLAILDASNTLSSEAPGGAGTVYVLSQSANGFRLAASTSSANGSDTTRNVGIGLGGLALLVVAVAAGFMIGRRSSVSA